MLFSLFHRVRRLVRHRWSRSAAFENMESRRLLAADAVSAVVGDWNQDGIDTLGEYVQATGQVLLKNTNAPGFPDAAYTVTGLPAGVCAIAGDWNGDGLDTVSFYDPATGDFYLRNNNADGGPDAVIAYGAALANKVVAAGDLNGDGADDLAFHTPATGQVSVDQNLDAAIDAVFALPVAGADWRLVAGDWDGNGVDTLGACNVATGQCQIDQDGNPAAFETIITNQTLRPRDQALAGDWDGNGLDTLGSFNPDNQIAKLHDNLVTGRANNRFYFTPVESSIATPPAMAPQTITAAEAQALLCRGAAASASSDAVIAVVDRNGRILGVRTESGVLAQIPDDPTLVFAIDGAVAKARTAAFFSSNEAPLTSRTVRFISQSTITQREVESNPNVMDPNSTVRGPGFVAPIGLGGHFPPEVQNTPEVDLFGIEHTNRDSLVHPGADSIKGTGDDIALKNRFNTPNPFVAPGQNLFAPESYGFESGRLTTAQSRGIATLPGGVPLYKNGELVGGIGVFFPGADGYATHEQGFTPGINQTEAERTNAAKAIEAEWIAFAAAGGSSAAGAAIGDLGGCPALAGYDLPSGCINLAGILLEAQGPHPLGLQQLLFAGQGFGVGNGADGVDQAVTPGADNNPNTPGDNVFYRAGLPVPEGWIVLPHGGGKLSAAEVQQIIQQGVDEANAVRAQIRLPIGTRTKMVFSVADENGNVLGLYRMPDATVFSLDVAVAKARNTVYYADPTTLQAIDRVDDNNDGVPDVAAGVAFNNRTFRFLALPRFPSSVELGQAGDFSILNDPGINTLTAENLDVPRPASAYTSVYGFDSFHPGRNFRDPNNIANQNGIVFFPGSTPLYRGTMLLGGFGVSGDGVDQDDVVTSFGARGFDVPLAVTRADDLLVRNVRLPYYNFPRNPHAP